MPKLHPRYISYIQQAFLFAIVWGMFGFIYGILEKGILGDLNYYPATNTKYDFVSAISYATFGGFIVGWLHGLLEVGWLRNKFTQNRLWFKIVVKTLFYLLFSVVFILILSTAVNSYRLDASPTSDIVIEGVSRFFWSFSFLSVIMFVAFGLVIAMLFSELSTYLGQGMFWNFLLGKYHTPNRENRIFMFLDMESSTSIAEKIGHAKYFRLLRRCFAEMTNPILEASGEVYQYVGDEIVISWPLDLGAKNGNCLNCYFGIAKALEANSTYFKKRFGVVPVFKAGVHMGVVTTGEIGVIKKEIIYTGDVLNTTARIQGQCKNYDSSLLLSESLHTFLKPEPYRFRKVAQLKLRGKQESVGLFALQY